MKSFCVWNNTIQQMKDFVFNHKVEHCVYLKTNGNMYYFDKNTISKGQQQQGRNMCEYRGPYAECIFHSHPYISRSYPSREDILKVMKRKEIKCSIISTRWGIYTIKLTNNSYDEYKKYLTVGISYLEKDIKSVIDKIGELEDMKGYSKVNQVYPTDINSDDLDTINDYLNALEFITKLNIKFYSWDFFYKNNIII